MTKTYTDRWNGFQFREPVYLDGRKDKYRFDLVKWKNYTTPMEVIDAYSGKKVMMNEYCFSIGTLIWNLKEEAFEFKSCGLRYLEHRIDGLEKFIIEFALMMEEEFLDEEN